MVKALANVLATPHKQAASVKRDFQGKIVTAQQVMSNAETLLQTKFAVEMAIAIVANASAQLDMRASSVRDQLKMIPVKN